MGLKIHRIDIPKLVPGTMAQIEDLNIISPRTKFAGATRTQTLLTIIQNYADQREYFVKSTHAASTEQESDVLYRCIAILTAGSCAVSLFFALVSPFGAITYLSFPERFMYWLLTSVETQAAYIFASFYAPRKWAGKLWQRVGMSSFIATPITFLTIISVQSLLGFAVPPQNFVWMVSFILPICFSMSVLFALLENTWRTNQIARDPVESTANDSLIRSRLPIGLRNERILALAAQDHYVEVHTAAGSHLVHMRLNDAEQLMPPGGVRVHRSWWVAADAVAEIRRADRQTVLVLKTGIEVSASRNGVGKLREAGWL